MGSLEGLSVQTQCERLEEREMDAQSFSNYPSLPHQLKKSSSQPRYHRLRLWAQAYQACSRCLSQGLALCLVLGWGCGVTAGRGKRPWLLAIRCLQKGQGEKTKATIPRCSLRKRGCETQHRWATADVLFQA